MKFFALLLLVALVSAEKVQIIAMVESLCPDCINFWTSTMKKFIAHEDLVQAVDLTIYPYGKAHTTTRDPPTFVCQHGPNECSGNFVLNCANKYLTNHLVDFYICMSSRYSYTDDDVKQCISTIGADESVANSIIQCARGSEGPKLHLESGDKTGTVWFVPYITVNGKFIGTNPGLLGEYVCEAIEGDKPASCEEIEARKANRLSHRHFGGRPRPSDMIFSPEEKSRIRERFQKYLETVNIKAATTPEEKKEKRLALKAMYRKLVVEAMESKLEQTSPEDSKYNLIKETIDRLRKIDSAPHPSLRPN